MDRADSSCQMVEVALVEKERNGKHSQGSCTWKSAFPKHVLPLAFPGYSLVGTTMTVAAVVTTMVTQAALTTETATTSIRAITTKATTTKEVTTRETTTRVVSAVAAASATTV